MLDKMTIDKDTFTFGLFNLFFRFLILNLMHHKKKLKLNVEHYHANGIPIDIEYELIL
jgi:hypothetical protein